MTAKGKNIKNCRSRTIKSQIILRCVLIMACTVLFNWCLNFFFLERYYTSITKKHLLEAYETLNAYNLDNMEESDIEDFENDMGHICSTYNISFIITDASSNTVISSVNNPDEFNQMLRSLIIATTSDEPDIIEENDKYIVANIREPDGKTDYITMYGTLDNGDFFMVRCATEGIRESAMQFRRFLVYIGILGLFLSFALIYFVTQRITAPIMELTGISKRMKELDFTARYEGHHHNEVDILGENFNQMSDTLEATIGQLKSANAKLKADVEEKTKLDDMRKEFLANVSHELKTPIALISGYAEGLKDMACEDEESREFYCDVIMDEAKKMNHMVKQLMQLNSLEFGNNTPDFERFSLTDLVKNCLSSSGEMIAAPKGINVESDILEDVYVWADEYQIEEVFRNYFNNAVNHVDDRKLIRVSMERMDDYRVKVSVFNTGKNIPEDSIGRIWDKFYKVDKAHTREYGGSGIGLSIVKAVMEAHGGDYGVVNEEEGVRFYFVLSEK